VLVGPGEEVMGEHDGAYRFTIGQRRGLGLSGHGEPLYVTGIDGETVHVGPRHALEVEVVEADRASWVAGAPPARPEVAAQVRYRGAPLPARVDLDGTRLRVTFTDERPSGVAPGQAVVLYDGDECLGGATITATARPRP
jgi:tRNA-uridine 2-sulfurtransferase